MSKWICSREQIVKNAPQRTSEAHRAPVLLSSKSYDGQQAAGGVGFFAIAEEQAGVAGRAKIARENICVAETGGEKLRTVGFAKVEANIFGRRLVARRHPVEPLQGIGFFAGAEFVKIFRGVRKLRSEFRDEFGADFVAAPA